MLEGRLGRISNAGRASWDVLRHAEACLDQEFRGVWDENLMLKRAEPCWGVLGRGWTSSLGASWMRI